VSTYGGIVRDVISELGRSDTSITSFAEQAVLNAIDHYAVERFWFNEGSGAITTSASLATYAWPTDMMEVDSVMATYSGSRYELEPMRYADLNALDTGRDFSQPVSYALFNGNFRFYPVPNATYTVSVDYQKLITTLSASTDSNAWTTYAEVLIRNRAKAQLAAGRYKDFDSAQAWHQMEENELDRLRLQTEKLLGTGRISPG
jgi:hypothetical protein